MLNDKRKSTKRSSTKATRRKKTRGPRVDNSGNVQISISMSPELIVAVEELAAREQRNRSNYIANELLKIAKAKGIL